MYISYVNTVVKARLFTAVFSQLTIFTADCLCHPIQMAGIETIWGLITFTLFHVPCHMTHEGVGPGSLRRTYTTLPQVAPHKVFATFKKKKDGINPTS